MPARGAGKRDGATLAPIRLCFEPARRALRLQSPAVMRAEKHARFECFVPACARVAVTCSQPEHRFERHRFAAAVSVAVEAMTLEARRINDARRGALPRGSAPMRALFA
jgi:hypothetical protein